MAPPVTSSPAAPVDNLFEHVDRVVLPPDARMRGATAFHRPQTADVMIFPHRRADGSPLDELRAQTSTERVWVDQGRWLLRFRDRMIHAIGAQLESGSARPMAAMDVARGKRVAVGFCDPNANKALHVGHLRNLAVGHAVAAAARAAGAHVIRQMQVGDCGRGMGEALAGLLQETTARTPFEAGMKGDHFVGECYTRYVHAIRRRSSQVGEPTDPALSREDLDHRDEADCLLERWRAQDPEVVALWRRARQWTVDGQVETLARLGIVIDRLLFESDTLPELPAVRERALAAGVATATHDGAIVHETGQEQYPRLLLTRPDGFDTQHMRYVGIWDATSDLFHDTHSIQVIGDEWQPLVDYGSEILRRIAADGVGHPRMCLVHGMLTVEGGIMKSSLRNAWLLDDLLDEIAGHEAFRELLATHDRIGERELTAIAALGHCLARATAKPLDVLRADICNLESNVGWVMACAWMKAWDPRYDGTADPRPEDPDYRFLVVQSQAHRGLVRRAYEEQDIHSLTRNYGHLSRWFLGVEPSAPLARAMRVVLGAGLQALGLTVRD